MFGIGVCCCDIPPLQECCLPLAEQFEDEHQAWTFRVEVTGAIDWTAESQMPGDPCYLKIAAHGSTLNGIYACEWLMDTSSNGLPLPADPAYCDILESWYTSPKQTKAYQYFENGVEKTGYYHMFALVRLIWSPIPNPNPLVYGYHTATVGHAETEEAILPHEPLIWRQTTNCCDDTDIECGPTTHYDWPDCQPGRISIIWNH